MRTLSNRSRPLHRRLLHAAALLTAAGAAAVPVATHAQSAPSIGFSAPSVTIDAPYSGAPPSSQSVVVRGTVPGQPGAAVTGLEQVSVQYQTISGVPTTTPWLKLFLDRTTTPALLQVSATNLQNVPGGSYRALLTMKGAGTAPQVLQVTLNKVPAQPELRVSATQAVILRAKPGDANATASQSLSVVSVDHRTPATGLTVSEPTYPNGNPGWLSVSIDRSVTPAVVTLSAKRTFGGRTMIPGQYNARIVISAPGAAGGPKTINVGWWILNPTSGTSAPKMTLNPGGGSGFGGGGSAGANATTRLVTFAGMPREIHPVLAHIGNAGQRWLEGVTIESIAYQGGSSGWLSLAVTGAQEYGNVVTRANATGLPVGRHTAVATLRAQEDPSPHTYTVTLDVLDPRPVLKLVSPVSNGANLYADRNGADPDPQTIAIVNDAPDGTDRDLTGLRLGPISYDVAASGWLTAELTGSTGNATIVLRARTGALREGTYTATFPVQADAGVLSAPRTVTVRFTVRPATTPVLALGATTVTLRAASNNPTPLQTISVSNAGGGTLSGLTVDPIAYGAGQPQGWLTATLAKTTAPAGLALKAAVGALPGGTYTARVTVRGPAGTLDNPRAVDVTFVVPSRPMLTLAPAELLLSAQAGSATARTATIAATNAGDAPLTSLYVSPAYDGAVTSWLATTLSATSLAPGAGATLTVRAPTKALVAGVYTATLRVSATGVAAVPARVTLEVVDLAAAEQALSDAAKLPAAERQRLDQLGNKDGTYNLGDYVALRARLGLAN